MKNILVIKLGALGDFIQALGPMRAIRAHHAGDRVSILTTKPFEKLARDCGYFDDVVIDRRPKWHDAKGWLCLRKTVNAGRYARVYDLQNNDRTGLYFHLFSPHPEWVGIAKGASHRNTSPERTAGKAYDGHVQTLGLAGIAGIAVDDLSWMAGIVDFEGLRKPYALLVPGSAPGHPEKRWPGPSYGLLCRRLIDAGIQPVLIGSAAEAPVLEDIAKSGPEILNLCGRTALTDIPALARGAIVTIGNDTGPMHLIAPTGCRTLVLFSGQTNPRRHGPLGPAVSHLQEENIADIGVDAVWRELDVQHISE